MLILIESLYYFHVENNITFTDIKYLGLFSLIELIYIYYSWYKLTGNYLDAYIIFILACYAFNLGQPILEFFDAVSPARSIITHYKVSLNVYGTATFISSYFLFAFHVGAIFAIRSNEDINLSDELQENYLQVESIYKVALYFAIFSFPFYIYNTISNMVIVSRFGYDGIYMDENKGFKLFSLIADYFTPAMICLYFASEISKKNNIKILLIVIATILLPPLYIGGRSNMVIILSILLLIYSFFHTINKKAVVALAIGGYCVLIMLAAIANSRGSNEKSIDSYTKIEENKGNPATWTLTEMGSSELPLIWCINILPEKVEYKYGESYLYSLTTIIPNMGFWDRHPAAKYSNVGEWLMHYRNMTYGPGFSITAEAYYNFGWFGFVMMGFLGYVFTCFFRNVNQTNLVQNPIKFIMAIVLLWFTIKLARNSFLNFVRSIFYYYLPMYWLMYRQYKMLLENNQRFQNFRN